MLKVGDKLPAGTLSEFVEAEGNGCSIGPNAFDVTKTTAGKKVAIFALPGAFTPTCSAQHVPGYVQNADALKAAGVDEIWCLSVNDAFVMKAWAEQHDALGKIVMLADGSGLFSKALGIDFDIPGMGLRARRGLFMIEDGTVTSAEIEAAGKFDVSSAEACLTKFGK